MARGDHVLRERLLEGLELQEGLAFLSQRMHELELDGEPDYEGISGIYGLARLPVRFTL